MSIHHGRVIEFKDRNSLSIIPTRNQLLNQELKAAVDKDIYEGKPLTFLPNTSTNVDNYVTGMQLLLIGVLTDGQKIGVLIVDPKLYFDVLVPSSVTTELYTTKLQKIAYEKKYDVFKFEIIKGRSFRKYEKDTSDYVRMYFKSLYKRKMALKYIQDVLNDYTTSDDASHYERVICRDNNFSLTTWNTISKYKQRELVGCKVPVFEVTTADINRFEGDILDNPLLARDSTLVLAWDIEAYSDIPDAMPNQAIVGDAIFVIGKTFHWRSEDKAILRIGLVSRPCAPRPDKLTIVCKSERDLIMASAIIDDILKPEYIIGFNDGGFDWPYLIERAKRYSCLEFIYDNLAIYIRPDKRPPVEKLKNILDFNCRTIKIKVESGMDVFSTKMTVPGIINIDAHTVLRKLNPKAKKTRLKDFLAMYGLKSKEDMGIQEMFGIYRNSFTDQADLERMKDVVHYCVKDAKLCQELMLKVGVIGDKREESEISCTSLFDGFNYADGCKVRNMVMQRGKSRGIQFTSRVTNYGSGEKFTGGYVFQPVPGLVIPKFTVRELKASDPVWQDVSEDELVQMENYIAEPQNSVVALEDAKHNRLFNTFLSTPNKYPVSVVDYNSLYPSIIMAGNISPEYLILTLKEKLACEADGHVTRPIDFSHEGRRVKAWTIMHDTYDGERLHEGKTVNKFGLYPAIQKELMSKRVQLKNQLKRLTREAETMVVGSEEHTNTIFKCKLVDSRQKAVKVFMNTFYGVTGSVSSSLFVLEIAGGITAGGREIIRDVTAPFLVKNNCTIYYGDTDSCFASADPANFTELDRKYYSGKISKLDYCSALIPIAITKMEELVNELNALLVKQTGTVFMVISQDSTFFPFLPIRCKMYLALDQFNSINFEPSGPNLLAKGLPFIKRDASGVLVQTGRELVNKVLDIHNLVPRIESIKVILTSLYSRVWDPSEFKKSAVFKTSAQNISVIKFRERMIERKDPRCPPPSPGERFEYVVVDMYPFKYDHKGRKTKLSVGEMMEYYDYATEMKMSINFNYYITAGVVGLFSQFIATEPEHYVKPEDDSTKAYDDAVNSSMHSATKYITSLCEAISPPPACKGPMLKALYKSAFSEYSRNLPPCVAKLLSDGSPGKLYETMHLMINKEVAKTAPNRARLYVDHMRSKHGKAIIYTLYKIFQSSENSLVKIRSRRVAATESTVRQFMIENHRRYDKLFKTQDAILQSIIDKMQNNTIDDNVNIMDQQTIKELYDNYINLKASVSFIECTRSIIKHLEYTMNCDNRINTVPPSTTPAIETECTIEFLRRNMIEF